MLEYQSIVDEYSVRELYCGSRYYATLRASTGGLVQAGYSQLIASQAGTSLAETGEGSAPSVWLQER